MEKGMEKGKKDIKITLEKKTITDKVERITTSLEKSTRKKRRAPKITSTLGIKMIVATTKLANQERKKIKNKQKKTSPRK